MSGSTKTVAAADDAGVGSSSGTRSVPEDAFKGDGSTWTGEKEKIILGPYDYLFDRPGKDIRRSMISAFNVWLKVPEERLAIINKVVGMLHTASLLYLLPLSLSLSLHNIQMQRKQASADI